MKAVRTYQQQNLIQFHLLPDFVWLRTMTLFVLCGVRNRVVKGFFLEKRSFGMHENGIICEGTSEKI